MGLQNNTDAVIRAYHTCRKIMAVLEKEHGTPVSMHESADGYTWMFEDRFSVKLDKNGNIT